MLPSNKLFEKYSILKETQNALRECDFIKYAAYRTAAKLQTIQKSLHMDKVSLKIISSIFDRHQLRQTENSVKLDQRELESVLTDIYFIVQKESNLMFDLNHVSQLMIAFLLSVYDRKMTKSVLVLSFKICLTILCPAKPREKYHYLFDQLADHNNCLSRKKLEILLKKMIFLIECIGEGPSFGSDLIGGTVESCFKYNTGALGVSEDNFITWLMQDPQLLVWLSTFYRLQISETVTHNAKCAMCKIYPLVGLRYRCLRCLSCDMCQMCFFTGKLSKKHKLKHPVQEYCSPMTSHQSTKAFLLTLRNKLYKKNSKLQYLPALQVDSAEMETLGQSTRLLDEMEISSRTIINGSYMSSDKFPYKELQSIISHLETESEKLIPQIENLCEVLGNSTANVCQLQVKNCLIKHKSQVEAQIQRIKLLKNYLITSGKFDTGVLSSTPIVDGVLLKNQKKTLNSGLENMSPITRRPSKIRQTSDKKMMWDNYDFVNYGVDTTWEEIKSRSSENYVSSIFTNSNKDSATFQSISKYCEKEMTLSTWLGGKNLKECDSSSLRGFSWLQETLTEPKVSDKSIWKENEETFQELQTDLKLILNKLNELSFISSKAKSNTSGNKTEDLKTEMQATEVDTLLVDLINGIEKLMPTML